MASLVADRVRTPAESRMKLRILVASIYAIVAAHDSSQAESLRILHIDVDQGDATLFVSPSGKTMLVDSGKDGHGVRIRTAMSAVGVDRIDHLITTHYHEDHYGGADELVTGTNPIDVVSVHDRGDKEFLPAEKVQGDRFVEYENALGHRAHHLMRGESIPLDLDMVVTCIASGSAVLGESDPIDHGADENDMSIALLVQYGDFRYFVGGDIEAHTEEKIAQRSLVVDVDVYQADHHGSHTSSENLFLRAMSPTLIVISNGDHGGFRHPRQITLDKYGLLSPVPTVLQLNKYTKGGDGGNTEDEFISDLEPSGQGDSIVITVQADGSYLVAYRDISHDFQSKAREATSMQAVVIVSLLPDPNGSDRDLEEVRLRNMSASAVEVSDWFLRDGSGRVWSLASLGHIPAGVAVVVVRAGMAMSLDNAGDEIELVDGAGQVVHHVSYAAATPGEEIIVVQ